MFVDPKMLHIGGSDSRCAGGHAQEGVDALLLVQMSSGMFGEFAAADAYHHAASSAYAQHAAKLHAYQQALTDIGSKAHRAAARFNAMDTGNAADMKSVPLN